MKGFKKIILNFIVCIALILIALGCESKESKEKRELEQQAFSEAFQELLLKPDENKINLLALKYKNKPEKIEDIITSYQSVHDHLSIFEKHFLQDSAEKNENLASSKDETVIQTINKLSKRYDIPTDIIASIIIDFQMWCAAEDDLE